MSKNPYQIIKFEHVTEKSKMLHSLQISKSNPSIKKFELPKYTFIVDPKANKQQIAAALEEIYREKNIKVLAVNTLHVKPKVKRRRGRVGKTAALKKAIVTLEKGDSLD